MIYSRRRWEETVCVCVGGGLTWVRLILQDKESRLIAVEVRRKKHFNAAATDFPPLGLGSINI